MKLEVERGARCPQLVRKCATHGCNRLAWNDDCCMRCEEEIRALEQMEEMDALRLARAIHARDLRSYARQRRLAELCRRVGRRLAIAALVAGLGLICLVLIWGFFL